MRVIAFFFTLLFRVLNGRPTIVAELFEVKRYPIECEPLVQPEDIQVFMTISSLASFQDGITTERQIELNWYNGLPQSGDTIALLKYNPGECNLNTPVLIIDPTGTTEDWYRTSISFPRYNETDLVGRDGCLEYWVAYVRNGVAIATNCIKTNKGWMTELATLLGEQRLQDILLPGTHDAGAYSFIDDSTLTNIITRYGTTQEENLFNQLYFGIRYLDIRIKHLGNTTEKFWIHHGPVIYRPLLTDIERVKKFLDLSNDIVIFDIHGIEIDSDKHPEAHTELQALLEESFQGYIIPNYLSWDATLNDLWSYVEIMGLRGAVVVTYSESTDNPMLSPAVSHKWGNVQSTEDLKTYLDSVMQDAEQGLFNYPWSAMAELTPTDTDIITDRLNGLRSAADMVNRNVSRWLREGWINYATIVSNDFFLGTNVVDSCIHGNIIRYS